MKRFLFLDIDGVMNSELWNKDNELENQKNLV